MTSSREKRSARREIGRTKPPAGKIGRTDDFACDRPGYGDDAGDRTLADLGDIGLDRILEALEPSILVVAGTLRRGFAEASQGETTIGAADVAEQDQIAFYSHVASPPDPSSSNLEGGARAKRGKLTGSFRISSTIFLASANSIMVLSRKKSSFSTPA